MRGSRIELALILCVTGLALASNLVGIGFGQPTHYDQSVDGVHPLVALDALDHLASPRHVVAHKYPRAHYLLQGVVDRGSLQLTYGLDRAAEVQVELLALLNDRPSENPRDVRGVFRGHNEPIGTMIVAGRVLSAVMGALAVLALLLFTRELFGAVAGAVAGLGAATSFPLVFYSHTLNVDIPYLCWGTFALYLAARAVKTGAARYILLSAFCVAASGATKDQAFAWFLITLPLVLFLLAKPGRMAPSGDRRFPTVAVCVTALLSFSFYALLIGLPFDWDGVRLHFDHVFGEGVVPYRVHPFSLTGQWSLLLDTGMQLKAGMGAPLLVAGLLGSVLLLFRGGAAGLLAIVPALSYYLCFIAMIGYVTLRFTLPLQLHLLVGASVLFARILLIRRWRILGAVVLLIILGIRLGEVVELDRLIPLEPRSRAEAYLESELPDGALIGALLEQPAHNLDLPASSRVMFVDPTHPETAHFPESPDYWIVSTFHGQRTLSSPMPSPPNPPESLKLQGVSYRLTKRFTPDGDHTILRHVVFQPTVAIYVREEGG